MTAPLTDNDTEVPEQEPEVGVTVLEDLPEETEEEEEEEDDDDSDDEDDEE